MENWRETKMEALLSRLLSWDILLNDDNEQDVFLDTLDNIFTQCINKQIEVLQAKQRSSGLSVEEKKELNDLTLQRPK